MMTSKEKIYQKENQFIKLDKENVQNFINLVDKRFKSKSLIDHRYKFIKEEKHVLIPLNEAIVKEKIILNDLMKSIQYEIVQRKVTLNSKFKFKKIEHILKNRLPESALKLIPKSFDIIGSTAIVEFPTLNGFLDKEKKILKTEVAEAITIVNKSVKSVYEKVGQVKGEYRLRPLHILYGTDEPVTIHKENHAIFKLNIKEVYFTPRLVSERQRIINSEIKEGELIVDMFAGVGPFSIQIAKNRDVKIYSFDINSDAYKYLRENILLNKVEKKVFAYNIDTKILLDPDNKQGHLLHNRVDRIIMNLPESSIEFLDVACFLIKKSGGIIHNYQFCAKPDPIDLAIKNITNSLTDYKFEIKEIISAKKVKSYSPNSDLISIDVKLSSK